MPSRRHAALGIALAALLLSSCQHAAPKPEDASAPIGTPRLILVGDSTVAPKSGWGDGLCRRVQAPAACLNLGYAGRSTRSYREEGSWDYVLAAIKEAPKDQTSFVLIQFGHNDQPGKPYPSDAQQGFPENLRRFINEVRAAGARPVLITSLTRRGFENGRVTDNLEPWADATRRVAREEKLPLLDLHADSMTAVQAMGLEAASEFAMAPPKPGEVIPTGFNPDTGAAPAAAAKKPPTKIAPHVPGTPFAPFRNATGKKFDITHLGPKGEDYFGAMVARELVAAVPALSSSIKP